MANIFERIKLKDKPSLKELAMRLLRGRFLVALLPVVACHPEDGENVREVAIVPAAELGEEPLDICLKSDEGEELCDPEWRKDIELPESCTIYQDGTKECNPPEVVKGAWVYQIPFENREEVCWDFENVPKPYLVAQENAEEELDALSGFCFTSILIYDGEGRKPDFVDKLDQGDIFILAPEDQFNQDENMLNHAQLSSK